MVYRFPLLFAGGTVFLSPQTQISKPLFEPKIKKKYQSSLFAVLNSVNSQKGPFK